jgi:AcrR family transcriptional regulator
LARAEGVTRAAVRKLWPTQAAFRLDLFAHLLARHRDTVVRRLAPAPRPPGPAEDVLLRVGDDLYAQVCADVARVSHLTFAPQFVLPGFRAHAHRHVDALVDRAATTLEALLAAVGRRARPGLPTRGLAVVVLALVDGATRLVRTRPDAVRAEVEHRGRRHSLFAVAFTHLVLGLTHTRVDHKTLLRDLRNELNN